MSELEDLTAELLEAKIARVEKLAKAYEAKLEELAEKSNIVSESGHSSTLRRRDSPEQFSRDFCTKHSLSGMKYEDVIDALVRGTYHKQK